jgi:hypothetical protein
MTLRFVVPLSVQPNGLIFGGDAQGDGSSTAVLADIQSDDTLDCSVQAKTTHAAALADVQANDVAAVFASAIPLQPILVADISDDDAVVVAAAAHSIPVAAVADTSDDDLIAIAAGAPIPEAVAGLDDVADDDVIALSANAFQLVDVSISLFDEDDAPSMAAHYDAAVWRGYAIRVDSIHQETGKVFSELASSWQPHSTRLNSTGMKWDAGVDLSTDMATDWSGAVRVAARDSSAWDQASPLFDGMASWFTALPPRDYRRDMAWQEGEPIGIGLSGGFKGLPARKGYLSIPWQEGAATQKGKLSPWQKGRFVSRSNREPWQEAGIPHTGKTPRPPRPPVPPLPVIPPGLIFICDFAANAPLGLIFGRICYPGWYSRRVYIVKNHIEVKRLADNVAIEVMKVELSIDRGSWGWSFSCQVPFAEREKVDPVGGPVEIAIIINGFSWHVLIEKLTETRRFANNSITVSGRSLSAYLGDPYAPQISMINLQPRNAQQLANDWLINTGWELDWQCADWLVAAGAYSVDRTRAIDGISQIAAAAGAYLQSDRQAQTLHALAAYPSAPWSWANGDQDISIPAGVLRTLSRQWLAKPAYNAVAIRGQNSGVDDLVKITGMAGDFFAPSIVDPLITHDDAARARGLSILGDTGKMAMITLELPIYEETGLIEVGKLARVVEDADLWLGLTRGTSVSAEWANGLKVTQTIEIERHYYG